METRGSARIKAAQAAKALVWLQATHIIWTPEDADLHEDALKWATFKNKKAPNSHLVIENGTNCFKDIKPSTILYLHCHGIKTNELTGNYEQNNKNGQSIEFQPEPDQILWAPKDMAEYLIANGLNPEHQQLELASCYSNQFSKELFECLTQDGKYPNLSVYGYHRMYFKPDQEYPYGLANVQDNITKIGTLIENEYEKVDILRYHDARLSRVCYGENQKINRENRESLRKALNDNLPDNIQSVELKVKKFDESIVPDGNNTILFSPDNFPIRTSLIPPATGLEQRREATYAEVVKKGHLNLYQNIPVPRTMVNQNFKTENLNSDPNKTGKPIKPG